jgi:hypothetical protein
LLFVRTTLLLGCALCLSAQSDDQSGQSDAEYGGPAILSRGQFTSPNPGAPISLRPYIGLSGIYDNGLLPVSVTSTGQIPSPNLFGVELNLGIYGYHTWKHTTLALNYKGDLRHYSQQSYYDGSDHFLSLILTHKPSKRVEFTLRTMAGIYSQNYFLSGAVNPLETGYLQIPQNDIYDNTVVFLSTAGDLVYRKNARLSFSFGGEGDLIRRRSTALYGLTSEIARVDTEYRVTRHSTIGVDYRFSHFDYTRGYGSTDLHSVGLDYSTQLTRGLQFSARIGGARVQTFALTTVPIDPAVAALLGISFGIETAHSINYVPDVSARLMDTFSRSRLTVGYSDGVSAGNGVYLTSRMESAGASYNYTGIHHWDLGISGSYNKLSTIVQTLGTYSTYGGGLGITRDLGKGLHAVLRGDEVHYDIGGAFQRFSSRVMLGLNYSPGDVPLALW